MSSPFFKFFSISPGLLSQGLRGRFCFTVILYHDLPYLSIGKSRFTVNIFIFSDFTQARSLVTAGRFGGLADLDRTGGGGMGDSEGRVLTPSTTQTNKKPLSPKRWIIIYPRWRRGTHFWIIKWPTLERTGKGNRLLMPPFKKSRKNKKAQNEFYKKRPSGAET